MMRLILSLLITCFISLHAAWAQGSPSPQIAQYDEWLRYYYFYKDNGKVNGFLHWLQDSQMLEKNEEVVQPITAFLSIVFKENPHQVSGWVRNVLFTSKTKEAIERALWLSGNGKLIAEIFKESPNFANSNPSPLINRQLKDIDDVVTMWDSFFASGDPVYVKKIIDILDDGATGGEKSLEARGFAAWTLGSYMIQHELVNRLVRQEIKVRTGIVKKKLEEIVVRNDQSTSPMPDKAGDFSTRLLIADEKELAEFKKTSNEPLHFKNISKAKRGDTLAIKILFTGIELTDDLKADVTYDLKILDPDGQVYHGVDVKNVEGLKTRLPMRFRIFDNASYPQIRFGSEAKLGKYKIIAAVHDNVGKKTIPLTMEFDLTEQERAPAKEGDLVTQELSAAQRSAPHATIDLTIITRKGFVSFTVGTAWSINALQTKLPVAAAAFQILNSADEGTPDSTNLVVSLYQPDSEKAQDAMKLIGKKYGASEVTISKNQDWTIYTQQNKQGERPTYTIVDATKPVADVIIAVRLAWPHLKNNPPDYDEQMQKILDSVLRSIHGNIGPRSKRDGEILRRPTP